MLLVLEKDELNSKDIWDWQELWEELDSVSFFSSYSWYLACRDGLKQCIHVWYVYYEGELIGIFPFCLIRRNGVTCWGIIGKPYTDKCAVLMNSKYFYLLSEILSEIGRSTPVLMEEVPGGWKVDNAVLVDKASVNPFVLLKEDILRQVKRKEWNNIKSKSENKGYIFRLFRGEEVRKNIHIIWEIEKQSNKPARKRTMFDSEAAKALFVKASEGRDTILAVLFDGVKPIAHMFGYTVKNKVFHAHHMSFLEEYSKDTPGKIVIYLLISNLKERGFDIFDFSRGETMLKKHFSTYKEINYNYYFNCTWNVRLWFRLCMSIKRGYRTLRHSVKGIITQMKKKKV